MDSLLRECPLISDFKPNIKPWLSFTFPSQWLINISHVALKVSSAEVSINNLYGRILYNTCFYILHFSIPSSLITYLLYICFSTCVFSTFLMLFYLRAIFTFWIVYFYSFDFSNVQCLVFVILLQRKKSTSSGLHQRWVLLKWTYHAIFKWYIVGP